MAQYDLLLTQNVHASGVEFSEKYVNLAKGSLLSALADGTPAVLAAGSNTYILVRDDAEVTGLKWIAQSGGHTQNTDTGTTSAVFEIDSDGYKIEITAESATKLGIKVDGGATYADLQAKDITANAIALVTGTISTLPSTGNDIVNKTYADSLMAANDAMQYKGVIDCSTNPNYPAAVSAGEVYKVSVAGKIGGASGVNVEVGDMIICTVDTGSITAIGATTNNTNGTLSADATYTNGGAGFASTTNGLGTGATFNVVITGGVPSLVLNKAGIKYSPADTIVVAENIAFSTLATGTLNAAVSTISNNAGTQAQVGSQWNVIQVNLDGAVIGPASATNNGIALFDGTTGKLIKSSNAVGTMAYETATDYITKATFDANTIIKADTDNTPVALTVGEQTLVGRITAGVITALTVSEVRTMLDVAPQGDFVLKATYDANTILAANTDNTPLALTIGASTIVGRTAAGNIAALTPAETMNILWVAAPAALNSTGTAGQIAKDANWFYICTATNTWKRSPIATNWT